MPVWLDCIVKISAITGKKLSKASCSLSMKRKVKCWLLYRKHTTHTHTHIYVDLLITIYKLKRKN